MVLMFRFYNKLDQIHGNGDGVLSKADGLALWKSLMVSKTVPFYRASTASTAY